jgi:hypothetical protein
MTPTAAHTSIHILITSSVLMRWYYVYNAVFCVDPDDLWHVALEVFFIVVFITEYYDLVADSTFPGCWAINTISPDPRFPAITYVVNRSPLLTLEHATAWYGKMPATSNKSSSTRRLLSCPKNVSVTAARCILERNICLNMGLHPCGLLLIIALLAA